MGPLFLPKILRDSFPPSVISHGYTLENNNYTIYIMNSALNERLHHLYELNTLVQISIPRRADMNRSVETEGSGGI